jgi:hypothetical protein
MKTTLNHALCVSLLLLSFGCGKSGSGGGSSTAVSPLSNANLSATSQQAVANFQAWYNTATDSAASRFDPSGVPRPSVVTRNTKVYSASGNCSTKPVSIFGLSLGNINLCSSSTPSGTDTPSQITIDPNLAKSSNSVLANIYNGSVGTLSSVTQQGTAYNFQFLRPSGTMITYIIDTNYPVAVQPMYSFDYANYNEVTVTNIQ